MTHYTFPADHDQTGHITNGDSHDHDGGDGAQIDYGNLSGTPTLGDSAALDVGTTSGTVAAGDDSRFGAAEAFPVGSVFIAVVDTNPATLLGYGTWSAFGAGRMLIGIDSGDTDFDTVEETGGDKTHTLTIDQLPAHSHSVTDPGHDHTVSGNLADPTYSIVPIIAAGYLGGLVSTSSDTTGITIDDTGGDGPVDHMNPYIVVYMWKRTA